MTAATDQMKNPDIIAEIERVELTNFIARRIEKLVVSNAFREVGFAIRRSIVEAVKTKPPRIVPEKLCHPVITENSDAITVIVFYLRGYATTTTIVWMDRMKKLIVLTTLAAPATSNAPTSDAYPDCGDATVTTIAVMDRMRKIARTLAYDRVCAPRVNTNVKMVNASPKIWFATVDKIVRTGPMNRRIVAKTNAKMPNRKVNVCAPAVDALINRLATNARAIRAMLIVLTIRKFA